MIVIKGVAKTVAVITIFSSFERLLGFIYRIYLSRVLGAELLGVYQIALSILGLLMTITSSGIPITISRLIIKDRSEGRFYSSSDTVSSGILLSLLISLPISFLIECFPNLFTFLFSDERCMKVLRICVGGLTFTSIYAVIRGSFWANKDFVTYSIIELLEEAVMIIAGIILTTLFRNAFDSLVSVGLAVTISYIFSFSLSLFIYFYKGGKFKNFKKQLKPLFNSSYPITCMKTATSITNTVISVLLPLRLIASGLTNAQAMSEYGKVVGMAMPLISMPSSLIGSLALVLVPELSSLFYEKKYVKLKNSMERAIKFSCLIACLIIPCMLSLGKEIGIALYKNMDAGVYVSRATFIMLPMSISIITTSMLNSLNKEKKTLLHFLIGASFMLLSIYFLPKYIGVYSLIVGLILNHTITSVLNCLLISKINKTKLGYKKYILVSTLFIIPSSILGFLIKRIFNTFLPTLFVAIVCCVIVGLFNLLLFYLFNMLDIVFPKKLRNNS